MSSLEPFMGLSYEPRNLFRGGQTTKQRSFHPSGSAPPNLRAGGRFVRVPWGMGGLLDEPGENTEKNPIGSLDKVTSVR
jgi:hypothetical protein